MTAEELADIPFHMVSHLSMEGEHIICSWENSLNKEISEATKFAISNPFHVKEFFVYGFKLMLHWDNQRNWFECVLHFSPYSSSYYHYGRTEKDLLDDLKESIKSWECEGRYQNYINLKQ